MGSFDGGGWVDEDNDGMIGGGEWYCGLWVALSSGLSCLLSSN